MLTPPRKNTLTCTLWSGWTWRSRPHAATDCLIMFFLDAVHGVTFALFRHAPLHFLAFILLRHARCTIAFLTILRAVCGPF